MNILQQLDGSHRMMLAGECMALAGEYGSVSRSLNMELVVDGGVCSTWFTVQWSYGACRTQSLAEACRVYESYASAKSEAA